MAVRPIDAVQVLHDINLCRRPTPVSEFESGFNNGLNQAMWEITNAPTLTQPNEWVIVEDRLPEVGQEVLVYWRNTSRKAEHFELTHYDGDHWFLLDNTERPWIVVVAWMPLPAPPDHRPPEGEEDTQ